MKYWEEVLAIGTGLMFSGLVIFTIYTGTKYGRPDLVLAVVPALVTLVLVFCCLDDFYM